MTDIEKISPLKSSANGNQAVKRDWSAPFGDVSVFRYNPNLKYKLIKGVEDVKTKDDVVKLTGLSRDYINSLIEFEGLELEEYKDAAGIRTIGIGHNIEADANYAHGKVISEQRAYRLLAQDLINAQKSLDNMMGKVELDKGEREALVDLIFNVGPQKVKDTKLIELIKNGDKNKALGEFDFIHIGKSVNKHLCERRVSNIVRFCGGKYPQNSKAAIEEIVEKCKSSLDEKIKNSNFLKKIYYQHQKRLFISEMDKVLERYKND